MPRNYRKGNNKRKYNSVDADVYEQAINDIRHGLSLRKSAKKHDINPGSLSRVMRNKNTGPIGRPTALSPEEEAVVKDTIKQTTEWGYGFCADDFRLLIQKYLNDNGRTVSRFANNLPGKDYVSSFCRRNAISLRKPGNIKTARAKVSEKEVRDFFTHLAAAGDVEPQNIFNYDETCVSDNPGSKKVLVPRGTRRVELVKEHSKVNISIMACGSASGNLLPPMVCYKAQNLYQGWTLGGPRGTLYDVSKSGWFEMTTFETWFLKLFIPAVAHLPGRKLLVGDNLASHFSPRVVELSRQHDIYFTALPSNATHMLQPLDVSVFHPMKVIWRDILDNFRKETRLKGTIPKEMFPVLLSEFWLKASVNVSKNLVSGFRCTGLYPRNEEEPIRRLPTHNAAVDGECARRLDNVLIDLLREHRGQTSQVKPKRGAKVPSGANMSLISTESGDDVPGTSGIQGANWSGQTARKKTTHPESDESSGSSEEEAGSDDQDSSSSNDDENTCALCACVWEGYTGPDWIKCVQCERWICGECNGDSNEAQFKCALCLN